MGRSNHRIAGLLAVLLLISACTVSGKKRLDALYGEAEVKSRYSQSVLSPDYYTEIKPLLESRCVVCHACYDAPCQLKLSSIEGIDRGANLEQVYADRLIAAKPSRLYIDASRTEQWRKRGFHPVLNERSQNPEANLEASLLYRMLELKRENPLPPGMKLPDDAFDFSLNRDQQCPSIEEFPVYAEHFPLWGMPYGLPSLNSSEFDLLKDWLASGALVKQRVPLDTAHREQVSAWESFLNEDSLKSQLMSRYLYEHLFLAHLYFEPLQAKDYRSQEFFRLVRSSTPPGEPIKIIATRRPYDDPGKKRVYYRLWRERSSISAKTHMPYSLSPERMDLWKELFLDADYQVKKLPPYEPRRSSNPFRTFRDIPVNSRYRFLLSEAQFTIMGFIKGPVCRGQTALNVIEDRFWVVFLNPDLPELKHEDDFLAGTRNYLELPIAEGSNTLALSTWLKYSLRQKEFLEAKDKYIAKVFRAPEERALELIWDGDGTNKNAALTIFRHFDSASVVQGFVGGTPKTAWLISYSLLERLHYLLVAGYDLFGNIGHQFNARVYMDFLRMEGESNFLRLLPPEVRLKERDHWYREAGLHTKEFLSWDKIEEGKRLGIPYTSADPKSELFDLLSNYLGTALSMRYAPSKAAKEDREGLKKLAGVYGKSLRFMPEISFLRVVDTDGSRLYSMLNDRGLLNVASLFFEESRRIPEEDALTVVPGVLGSYANAFFSVRAQELGVFAGAIAELQSEDDYSRLLDRFGVRRSSEQFWHFSDWLHREYRAKQPIEAGIIDYNRFQNR